MSGRYDFNTIEPKWQRTWLEQKAFAAANPGQPGSEKPKFYVLDFFPYPSGAGLHVGHPLGYIASDIIARFKRALGFNVLHPMGWDAFGLPAEQYAIETGVHPAETTRKNIANYRRQLDLIGLGYDWDREVATCEPDYYRWTQWIFLQIYDSWYDPHFGWTDRDGRKVIGKARPMSELDIPEDVRAEGKVAVAQFQDEHRLAYLAEVPVNWCPKLGTVLSNEEVTNEGRSDRGDHPVYRRPMKQWMLRITEYAERLLGDLEPLDWPEPIKLMQRNWIGRSEGAYVDFPLADSGDGEMMPIRVFTTRPDTLFGATYMVLAPEHHLVPFITTEPQRREVENYIAAAKNKSELERTADSKDKTGVFTGGYAVNPVNGQRVPIWVADYVLAGYGTGAIMAVPAHDTRDFEFAEKFELPIVQVVEPPEGEDWRGYTGDGVNVNSPLAGQGIDGGADLNGLPTPEAKRRITVWLESQRQGEGTVQFKLRDWLFSRQRYWGEPFPIAYHENGISKAIPESDLPVALPEMEDFRPTSSDDPDAEPQVPLSRSGDWKQVSLDGQSLRRELNTMPQWAGSCWYYMRFCDPHNEQAAIAPDVEQYWLGGEENGGPKVGGVDLYMGGAEHAVLHLLYARFWHKVLYDRGHVSTPEPFHKLFNQGMIQSFAFQREDGPIVARDRALRISGSSADTAQAAPIVQGSEEPGNTDGFEHWVAVGRPLSDKAQQSLTQDGSVLIDIETGTSLGEIVAKMSKSLKNVVNPDSIVEEYGADTLRLYEMSMGPLEASKPWNTRDIVGVHRFLQRVWRLVQLPASESDADGDWQPNPKLGDAADADLEKLLHKTIKKVEEDIQRFAFNTAVAQMIVWVNEANKASSISVDQLRRFLIVLAPFAPHICEELWQQLGGEGLICRQIWPDYDDALTRDDEVEIAVQIKGKIRGRITVPADADDDAIIKLAIENEKIAADLEGKQIRKAIVVKGRLVNLIV